MKHVSLKELISLRATMKCHCRYWETKTKRLIEKGHETQRASSMVEGFTIAHNEIEQLIKKVRKV